MKQMLEKFWESLYDTVNHHAEIDDNLEFHEDLKTDFLEYGDDLYKEIKSSYMTKPVEVLDRHKVAAVCIITTLEIGVIGYKRKIDPNKSVFLAPQMFATEVAFAWMATQLNNNLKSAGINEQIQSFYMPEAFVCSTNYFEIFSRSLYNAPKFHNPKDKCHYNPLDIAEKLFLLEYITLLHRGVDPSQLRDLESNK